MKKIPKILRDEDLKFYLIGKNSKLPMEKRWNQDKNYSYNHPRLIEHLKRNGNYGVCCGKGSLVVLDFDNLDFYNSVIDKLPPTFSVMTAMKQMYHLYYFIEGTMIKKIGIDKIYDIKNKRIILNLEEQERILKENTKEELIKSYKLVRVCDIQAFRAGVVAPGSRINKKYYNVVNNRKITTITKEIIKDISQVHPVNKQSYSNNIIPPCPEKEKFVREGLIKIGVEQITSTHYKCPFHDMDGKGNLSVMSSGSIYCFHCQKYWYNIEDFIIEYEKYKFKK